MKWVRPGEKPKRKTRDLGSIPSVSTKFDCTVIRNNGRTYIVRNKIYTRADLYRLAAIVGKEVLDEFD